MRDPVSTPFKKIYSGRMDVSSHPSGMPDEAASEDIEKQG